MNTGNTDETTSPFEAATTLSAQYIATLHSGLTTFLNSLALKCLKAYSAFYYAQAKNTEMRLPTAPVPKSVKNIKLTLHPVEEVKTSEDFNALLARLETETEALHRKWVTEYTSIVDTWNTEALLKRFQLHVCQLLHQALKGFIAQLGITQYSENTAFVDLVTTSPSELLLSPLPTDIEDLLSLYKKANDLIQLPLPTIVTENTANINTIINAINKTARPTNGNQHSEITLAEGGDTLSSTRTPTNPYAQTVNGRFITPGTTGERLHSNHQGQDENAQLEHLINPQPLPPINLARGRRTDFISARMALTAEYPASPPDQRPPPSFRLQSPTEESNSSSSEEYKSESQQDKELDASIAAIDVDKFTNEAMQASLHTMTVKLLLNVIQEPIREFHRRVTHREELERIRRITAHATLTSAASRITSVIQTERPADRPVLSGLIRDETKKSVSDLKRKLQSAMDSIERNQKSLKTLSNQIRGQNSNSNSNSKKHSGGNILWSRSKTTTGQASTAAAATSPTIQLSNPAPPPVSQNRQRSDTGGNNKASHTAAANATAARRRKWNNSRAQSKLHGKTNNSKQL